MASTVSTNTQQKFSNLRKRLDQLGYQQPLGIESLPLVERLFVDLVHTTESLKKAKLELGSVNRVTEKTGIPSQVDAYKSDNAKLLKENNDLHQKLIKQKEDTDSSIKDLKASLRKIEHENADLRFLNNQYVHKMRTIEKESKQKSDRIIQLQEKNFHAVVQTPGGRKKNIPFRRQRMEVDSTLPPASDTAPYRQAITQAEDPYIADMLKVADENIGKLNEEKRILLQEQEGLENKIHSFRKQVETRDSEIDRLTRLLEGGRPYDVVALETRNRSNERLISHLNIQIDYLQQKNAELQRQMDTASARARLSTDKTIDLDSRNQTLERELADVDVLAQQMQLDKDVAIRAADREIAEAKVELQKSRSELETMDLEVARLKAEKERLISDYDGVRAELSGVQSDKLQLEDLLDKVQEDKRRLGVRINKLTANEKDLVIEIDRLKYKNGVVKGKRSKSASPVEVFVKGLEEERDYWKSEVDVLQKLLRSKSRPRSPSPSSKSRGRSRSLSPRRSRSLTNTPTKKSASRASSPGGTLNKSGTSAHYDSIIKVLEDERDHYKREVDLLKAMRSRPTSPVRSRSPARDRSMTLAEETELVRVQRERDELQLLLDKFERHMAEIQANVQVLTSERDNLNSMYEETKEELHRLRREVVRSPKSPKTSLAAQAVLRRVENERDDAMSELRKLSTERDTLRERLKIATETQLSDRARMEQKIEDLDTTLHNTELERSRLEERMLTLQKLVESLEDQVKTCNRQLADARDEASSQLAAADQMRILAEQAERSLTDSKTVLTRREGELRHLDDKSVRLEEEVSALQRLRRGDQEELSRLKASISALDREKDTLQMEVDDKAEHLQQLNEELTIKERVVSDLRANANDLEVSLGRSKDTQTSKDREIGSLRRQLDSTNEELTEVGRGREVALRENRRLQEDLTTMTRENQRLHEELDSAVEERESLRTQIQDYVVEVKRCQELLSAKEGERSDLLEQYRSLSLEAERFETQTHQLESEGSSLRLELMTRESEIRRLHEKIGLLERDLQEHVGNERSYDLQLSSLTQSVSHLEDTVRQLEDEKHSILRDLSAVRDLCSQLEATKDALQRQLTNKNIDQDKLGNLLEDMKQETDMLRSQVSSERTSVKNLEDMLAANRHKEFETQMAVQEKSSDIQLLKDRLAIADSKNESHSRELSTARTRTMELESDVERIRRQLTSERFERERAVQELRRNGLPVPGESRSSRMASPITPSSLSRSRSPTSLRARSPARSKSPYRSSRLDDDTMASTHTA